MMMICDSRLLYWATCIQGCPKK